MIFHQRVLAACGVFSALLLSVSAGAKSPQQDQDQTAQSSEAQPSAGTEFLSEVRKLTFQGRRAGEGYFSEDGSRMVFQSERQPGNPFYQIYLMDLETGDVDRISPGMGKTTCAWIHPSGQRVLLASTHHDSRAIAKQQAEIKMRQSGEQRRYSWDYDPAFELYAADVDAVQEAAAATGAGETIQPKPARYTRLTDAKGYDAEGSYSPDGSKIVFASNRAAYDGSMTKKQRKQFEIDPAFMIDLYIMNADGSGLKRLTDAEGYDGGPFFSPDGTRICWRRFSPDGATAEIYTMNVDGTDVRRLTELGAMSWAPFYHPSGEFLVFTTNRHGFGNFELYLVRADGEGDPARVTHTDGFDGLPVFLPDGQRLSWTSNRKLNYDGTVARDEDGEAVKSTSQIFIADFDLATAREALGLASDDKRVDADQTLADTNARATAPEFRPSDLRRHVDFLARPELGGRLTGSPGERRATAYVAAYLESLGFVPAGDDGTFFQEFEFPAGSELGEDNSLSLSLKPADESLPRLKTKLGENWTPLSFSQTGSIKPSGVVFAGYGLQVPGDGDQQAYDSYVHLNVADQWVMVLRDLPQEITPEQRQRMARYSSARRKATIARDLGARGILFVTGPTSKVRRQLIRFDRTASQAEVSIAAVSIDDATAAGLLKTAGEDLQELQSGIDDGSMAMGFSLDSVRIGAEIQIQRQTGVGRNVLARLPAKPDKTTYPWVTVGAHIDHLGRGRGGNSLARDEEENEIHVGADDNASGVGAMLEIAQYIADQKRRGEIGMQRDLLIAAWSGEELGLFGSQAFVQTFPERYQDAPVPKTSEDDAATAAAHGSSPQAASLHNAIAAYLNLDMVGRLREKLIVQGTGSSPDFDALVQRRNVPVRLPLKIDATATGLPTDASAFVSRGVPILSAFTGAHEDYHTPRDTPEKVNYEGAAETARLFGLLTRGFLTAGDAPAFELQEADEQPDAPRAVMRAYLGTIPDYAASDVTGVKLSGVGSGGPAERAGVRGGDVIVEVAGRKIEDIYDYTYAIEALKIGETIKMIVRRDGKPVTLSITPTSRE